MTIPQAVRLADAVRHNLVAGVRLQNGSITDDEFDATTREVIDALQEFDKAEAATGAKPDLAERLAKALHEASNTIGCMGAYESCISRDEHERAARIAATGAKPDLLDASWVDSDLGFRVVPLQDAQRAINAEKEGCTECGVVQRHRVSCARLASSKEERA